MAANEEDDLMNHTITEDMIDAGVQAYEKACPDTAAGDRLDREMIVNIFQSMLRASAGD